MTALTGIERPFSGNIVTSTGETARMPVGALAATIPLTSVSSTTLTTVTATIHCSSIIIPSGTPLRNVTVLPSVAGTVTGFWVAVLDAGLKVMAVSANFAAVTTGFWTIPVLPVSTVPAYTSSLTGLHYIALGTVSTVAPQIGANPASLSVAAVSGPPVICGTSATAATITPPPVGTQLGALTGVATNEFYAHIS